MAKAKTVLTADKRPSLVDIESAAYEVKHLAAQCQWIEQARALIDNRDHVRNQTPQGAALAKMYNLGTPDWNAMESNGLHIVT